MYNTYAESVIGAGVGLVYVFICFAVAVLALVAMWKIYEKAGKHGWGAIIPLYNNYILYEIALGNGWLFLLTFVPCVGAIAAVIVYFKLASAFGKGIGYGFGLLFLPVIFLPMLAFGNAQYIGPQ